MKITLEYCFPKVLNNAILVIISIVEKKIYNKIYILSDLEKLPFLIDEKASVITSNIIYTTIDNNTFALIADILIVLNRTIAYIMPGITTVISTDTGYAIAPILFFSINDIFL